MKALSVALKMAVITTTLIVSGCSTLEIRTAVEIDAPNEAVYAVLADFEAYSEWNPYHRKIDGKFEEHADLIIQVTRPDGKEVKVPPQMMRIVENREITWGGGIKGVFYGVHSFLLDPLPQGKTLLRQNEDFSGFAIAFSDLPADVIAEGYQLVNRALKQRVERSQ